MAKGEKRWTGGDIVKMTFTPVPNKDWEVKLIASAVKVDKQKPESGGIPYLSGLRFQCFNSAEKEGGKDRIIFHALFLGLRPDKNGNVSPNYANGLNALMKAFGENPATQNIGILTKELEDGESIEYLDPKDVLQYLKNHDGDTLSLHSKIKNSETYGAQAQVDYFIEAEGASEASDEEAPEEEAEEAEEPEEDEAEEVEEEPAPKKKAAPAKKGKR